MIKLASFPGDVRCSREVWQTHFKVRQITYYAWPAGRKGVTEGDRNDSQGPSPQLMKKKRASAM